jgi:hypothetical protein
MKLARIERDTVVEIVDLPDDIDPASAFHPSLRFVKAAAGVKPGAKWDGKEFVNPVEVSEDHLPKEVLKDRALGHRRFLIETARIKVGEWQIGIDLGILATITIKILLIDRGVIKQPVKFRLSGGYATLNRGDLADLERAIAVQVEELFSTEAAVIEAIDKGQISTEEQIEAAFPLRIGKVPLPGGIG